MGPFPHDAPPPQISDENPMGTDGFEFVEFCHPDPAELDRLFKVMGFSPVARHRSKDVTLYRQGDVNFILNAEPESFAAKFAAKHGPSAPAMAFRVVDAKRAYERAIGMGAKPAPTQVGPNREMARPRAGNRFIDVCRHAPNYDPSHSHCQSERSHRLRLLRRALLHRRR